MPIFSIIEGNYDAIISHIFPMAPSSTDDGGKAENINAISKDLQRTVYFSASQSLTQLQDSLLEKYNADDVNYSYLQGDFDGGLSLILTSCYINNKNNIHHMIPIQHEHIRCCYTNDNGSMCGLSISIVPNMHTNSPEQYRFAVSIYQNVADNPATRKVMCISDNEILQPTTYNESLQLIEKKPILSSLILGKIKQELKSQILYDAISPIFKVDGFASKTEFDLLKKCFLTNTNNFQRVTEFIETRRTKKAETEAKLKQSYFRRNLITLLAIATTVIVGTGAIVAMIFTAPLAAFLAAAACFSVAILSCAKFIDKLLSDERSLKMYKTPTDNNFTMNSKEGIEPSERRDDEQSIFPNPLQAPQAPSDSKDNLSSSTHNTPGS